MTGDVIPIPNRRVMEIRVSLDTFKGSLSTVEIPVANTTDVTPQPKSQVAPPVIRPRTTFQNSRITSSLGPPPIRRGAANRAKQMEADSIEEAQYVKSLIQTKLPSTILGLAGLEINPSEEGTLYTYKIGKGNNSSLIRQLMKNRWWWKRSGDVTQPNFLWSQARDMAFLRSMAPAIHSDSLQPDKNFILSRRGHRNPQINSKLKRLGYNKIFESRSALKFATIQKISSQTSRLHNKIENNYNLSNKKCLLFNMRQYYTALGINPFDILPVSFHIRDLDDSSYQEFVHEFEKHSNKGRNIWIVKPGEYTNQGKGIKVWKTIEDISSRINQSRKSCTDFGRTYIVQKYIEKPLLINRRKFDIRCFGLLTSFNGVLVGYFYSDGYLRTASKELNLNNISNQYIHLTNDAIQKQADDYGKYENGNKLSYNEFQRYIDNNMKHGQNFQESILPQIREIVKDTFLATFMKIDSNRRQHTFELFGYDFMIDENWKPWLIEVNTNPCLSLSSNYLSLLIPTMLDNMLRLTLDVMFPKPPSNKVRAESTGAQENRFELIFHEMVEGEQLKQQLGSNAKILQAEDPKLVAVSDEAEEFQSSDEEQTV